MRQRAELAEGGFAMACIGHLLNNHLPQHPGLKTDTALCKETCWNRFSSFCLELKGGAEMLAVF